MAYQRSRVYSLRWEEISSSSGNFDVRHIIRELSEAAIIFLVIFGTLHFSIQNFRVDGISMYPTLLNEQHILVSKLSYIRIDPWLLERIGSNVDDGFSLFIHASPRYGEIIAFRYPNDPSKEFVKRVIGLPGDVIKLDRGRVIRNGKSVDEPYVVKSDRSSIEPVEVPEGYYYVLGDNRQVSNDSRIWGFVPDDHVVGRVWFSYWPSGRTEFLYGLW